MFRIPSIAKLAGLAAAALVAGSLATSAPAEARPGGGHGWRGHHGFAARHFHAPRFHHPRAHWRWGGPRYIAAPVYGYGNNCVIRKRWVPGPWGWHVARRRVCH